MAFLELQLFPTEEEVEQAAGRLLAENHEIYASCIQAVSGEYGDAPLAMADAAVRAQAEMTARGIGLLIVQLLKTRGRRFLGREDFDPEDPRQAGLASE